MSVSVLALFVFLLYKSDSEVDLDTVAVIRKK